ncbi:MULTISPECIES: phosphogluconate dehydratase [unclassified Lysobacter]|uniref:phosphogluconate dehydratase n=1 Tax=unclassified Lysobacter TaxID=2635362 RepID=UPI0006FB7970|nr:MULTISPECIES: phosphogluconate dehydratase [unclassified Lysobacter]KRA16948.1 phosphogluconate dehydratase [Lysobacter sp. Root604]KRD73890.1 phosphogluconate dehydratase [Lysobacter sp. Root983]
MNTSLHPVVAQVTQRIVERSRVRRDAYLARIDAAQGGGPQRRRLSCGNLAHGFAACAPGDKQALRSGHAPNLGIVTSYNDMLSAHQPLERFPDLLKAAAREAGATAQVAGGVPAMCDGVTQGREGMELSLFSRDVIAMSTAIALSHDMFDAALYLGVCDKIVPGLLIGALHFGHLPGIFVPAGPMTSGLPNDEKSRVRQRYATGDATRDELLEAEARSYHGPGTCTFYGTANSNQMLMELMGLHLPGSSFVHPNTPLRDALTASTAQRAAQITALGEDYRPIGRIVDERAIVNGVIGLHATGGSTNHLLHLIAIAAAAGIELRLEDFDALSSAIPLLARVYPNGSADVNHFHAAGGLAFLIGELLDAGLLHGDVETVAGPGLNRYRVEARLEGDGRIAYVPATGRSGDPSVLRPVAEPFRADGGLRVLVGELGTAAIKVSAVPEDRWVVEAPCRVFSEQYEVKQAFERGELERDVVVVVRFQGPRANGMPELHQLTPTLTVLQKRGHRVALVTDGRMSGASGQVPAAIHVTPEAACGGPLAQLRDGDVVRVDAIAGTLSLRTEDDWTQREHARADLSSHHVGMGRELFAAFRDYAAPADRGAGVFAREEG